LPQFFNPKDYMTIFSTLPTLKIGDEILVDFDGVRYRFLVSEMVELPPDDLAILEQHYDDSYISLVTCVPPGTYLRRLVVRARLAK
jgi:sortase A